MSMNMVYTERMKELQTYLASKLPEMPVHTAQEIATTFTYKTILLVSDLLREYDRERRAEEKKWARRNRPFEEAPLRPLQKPLTKDDLKRLKTPCVAVLEDKTDGSIRPVTIWRVDDLSVQFRGDCGLWLEEYGHTKRLWMCGTFRNPTDEERRAAEWMS